MNAFARSCLTGLFLLLVAGSSPAAEPAKAQAAKDKPAVYPLAVLPFSERGMEVKDAGNKISQLLFANLATNPELSLVEREEVDKLIQEMHLSRTGVVKADEAVQVGRLTGAKLLVTGSAIQIDKSVYLVAKIIGTETSRVLGASVKGPAEGDLGPLVEKLAAEIGQKVKDKAGDLVPAAATLDDIVAVLKKQLDGKKLPAVLVSVSERHISQPTVDPAAQTELSKLLIESGFTVIDAEKGDRAKADVLIQGEGFSELNGRLGNLFSVKARVEIKAIDRASGKVLVSERQTALAVEPAEQIAAKAALQDAAAQIALRLLPKLASAK